MLTQSETKRFFSKREFAALLGVSVPTVDRRIADGTLKVIHFGKRCLIPATAIDTLMNSIAPQQAVAPVSREA